MRHITAIALLFILVLTPMLLWAQPDFDYNNPTEYEIGKVSVVGAEFSDENAIINISGFKVGQKLKVPSNAIPKAIKSLWRLRLYTDIEIYISKIIGDVVFLEIAVKEKPRLVRFDVRNVKKSRINDIKGKISPYLIKGGIVTDDLLTNAINGVKEYYAEKGYLDAEIIINKTMDPNIKNGVQVEFKIDKKDKVKIQDIVFNGNKSFSDRKLRKQMKETKPKRKIFTPSKLIKEEYKNDKNLILEYYNNNGFRDAQIVKDSIWREADGDMMIQIDIEEGNRYFFRNITWKGNSIYSDEQLSQILGIKGGDVYNQELLNTRLSFSQDNRDVSSLYLDRGYLFFRVDPIESSIVGDSIDLEMRIYEGPQATIDKVVIDGNDRTHEHVIRRELRTKPGAKFSRSDLIRSQREIINLGYFDPENLGMNTPVNAQRGTVDIEYTVAEKSSDQLELSAGWGGRGRGVIGTLGVTFNNFSIRNIFKKESWSPLPQGDGQRLSLRAQTNGRFFQSYNMSFTEPWLGGKKAQSFTVSGFYSRFTNGQTSESFNYQSLGNIGASVSLGSRLKWPDDFFVASAAIGVQSYDLNNWGRGGFIVDGQAVTEGAYNNITATLSLVRNSINNPIFPQSGSSFSLTATFTPPYSLFNQDKDYSELSVQERFKFLEYHKWRFNADWYTPLFDKFVFKASTKIGMLGYYNEEIGTSPFERFELGGDGISNQFVGIAGRDIISSRGYESNEFAANASGGATVFNKVSMEIRYPFSLNPNATIYALTFFEGSNAWSSFRDFNPFEVRRTVGAGLRVFLPMFGTLGFDYGLGFDKDNPTGSNLAERYGNFNIVLGFEPD